MYTGYQYSRTCGVPELQLADLYTSTNMSRFMYVLLR